MSVLKKTMADWPREAARSNEFGYVNYEIIAAVAELNPLGIGMSPRR